MEVDARVKSFSLKKCCSSGGKRSWWADVSEFASARTLEPGYAEWYAILVAAGGPIVEAVGVHEPYEPVAGPSGASGSGTRPRRASATAPVYDLDSDAEFAGFTEYDLSERSVAATPASVGTSSLASTGSLASVIMPRTPVAGNESITARGRSGSNDVTASESIKGAISVGGGLLTVSQADMKETKEQLRSACAEN